MESAPAKKLDTGIEAFMHQYRDLFRSADESVLLNIKEDIRETSSDKLVGLVVKVMQAVRDLELHAAQKKGMTTDMIVKLISAMPIAAEEKHLIETSFLPVLSDLIDVLDGAARGHLIFHQPPTQRRLFHLKLGKQVTIVAPKESAAAPVVDVAPIVDEVYQSVKTALTTKSFTLANLISVGSLIMQVVDQYPDLTGDQKKQIVLQVAHNLNETSLDEATKATLNFAIDSTLNAAIDFIISAKKGQIPLVNEIEAKVKAKCCGRTALQTPMSKKK